MGERCRLDFEAQYWYTQAIRAINKPLILLVFTKLRGNPICIEIVHFSMLLILSRPSDSSRG
jgi:hypothetical protein